MADLALSAIQALLAALQFSQLKEIFAIWGYKSQLKELEETILTIRTVLLDADSREDRLSQEERKYMETLKDAVYDADDLFDEVLTLAQLKKHNKSDRLSKKVRDFFSPNNPLSVAYNMSREVKKIRKRLDGIASNHIKFGFKFDSLPIRRRGVETCSYVYTPDVIGREDDVKAVINKLLDSDVEEKIGFLTIVGVGGLGKTTLAQLVYHDERVVCDFPLRLWVCVSDQDGNDFDLKAILWNILELAGFRPDDGSSKEKVQRKFHEKLGGKKCLLVLDDVWNEDCFKWRELRGFLMGFGEGSRIIVTSRSKESARIIGNGHSCTYQLEGLSEEESWRLFELTAFGKGYGNDHHVNLLELVEIGWKIVTRCCNVPLAIKVVGSLLFGQDIRKWRAFEENGLTNTSQDGNMVTSILKLSYDNLNSPLKSCFSYCALFPKGFTIRKEMLINLWMSQGYTKPFYEGQSLEEAANEQYWVLLQRCFFQDVKMDEYGDVDSCKIHDLMHDVAQEVAGDEIRVASSIKNNLCGSKVRHLYEDREYCETKSFGKSKIRSYLQVPDDQFYLSHEESMLDPMVDNWLCLRALSLHHSSINRLPDAIGNLLHLRSLDLYCCRWLDRLPNSVTKLFNLQTLILANCEILKQLPKDFSKLVNIRHLDIRGCTQLTHMPAGLHKLTCLGVLTAFYVGVASSSENKQCIGRLRDLKGLKNLKGGIEIRIPINYAIVEERDQEAEILAEMRDLNSVQICFKIIYNDHIEDEIAVKHEALVEKLQPHANLKGLELQDYLGKTLRWGRSEDNWATLLPYLVKIQLCNCYQLQELPLLSELQHLRSLELKSLYNLEYIEDYTTSRSIRYPASSSRLVAESPFFPSLEYLQLHGMLKLKGWRRPTASGMFNVQDGEDVDSYDSMQQPSFPLLYKLKITSCPNLVWFPSCPLVESLHLREVNERLKLNSSMRSNLDSNVRKVKLGVVADLRALPPCHPTSITITAAWVETFSGASEVFKTRGSTSVRHLQIHSCGRLLSLSGGGFQHLTALQSLEISHCHKLSLSDPGNADDIPWKSFHQNLHSIKLNNLEKLEILPQGMQHLSSLRHLTIEFCANFQALPEWMSSLSSLQSLAVRCCGLITSLPEAMRNLTSLHRLEINPCSVELKDRCLNPDGDDWTKIQHVSDISFYSWDRESIMEALQNLSCLNRLETDNCSENSIKM